MVELGSLRYPHLPSPHPLQVWHDLHVMAYLPEVCATVLLALCSSPRLAGLVAAAVDTVEAALVAGGGVYQGQGEAEGQGQAAGPQGQQGPEGEGDYPAAVRSVVAHLAAHLYGPHAHTQYTELELEGCSPGLQGQQQEQQEQGHQQGLGQHAAACPGSSSPLAPASSSPPSDRSSSSSQDGSSSDGDGGHSCAASDSGAGGGRGGGGGSRHASCGSLTDVAAEAEAGAEAGAAAGTGETQDGLHATGVASTPDAPAGTSPPPPADATCPYPPALAALERAVASHADLLTALYCLMATSSLAAHLMCPPMGLAMASPAFRAAMTAVQLSDEDVRRLAAGLEVEDTAAGHGQEPPGAAATAGALQPPGAAAAAATAAAVLSCYPAAVSRGLSLDAVYAQLLGLGLGMAGAAGQGQGAQGQGCGAEQKELVDSRREFLKQVGGGEGLKRGSADFDPNG